MMEITSIQREEAFAEELELRREIIRKALDDKKYQTALQAADSRAKLRGLYEYLPRAIETVIDYGGTVDFASDATDKDDQEDKTANPFADLIPESASDIPNTESSESLS